MAISRSHRFSMKAALTSEWCFWVEGTGTMDNSAAFLGPGEGVQFLGSCEFLRNQQLF